MTHIYDTWGLYQQFLKFTTSSISCNGIVVVNRVCYVGTNESRNYDSGNIAEDAGFTHQFTPQFPLVCPLDLGAPAGLYDGSRKPTLAYKEPPCSHNIGYIWCVNLSIVSAQTVVVGSRFHWVEPSI